jgi:hypothetical protein
VRKVLSGDIQSVRVNDCELRRFGEPHDHGYPLCENLLGRVKSGYQYGINGPSRLASRTHRVRATSM